MPCQPRPRRPDPAFAAGSRRLGAALLALLATLAAAACGSGGGAGGGDSPVLPEAAPMDMAGDMTPEEAARVQDRVETALRPAVTDPILRYANVRHGVREAICGEVETAAAGGSGSGLRPFIVTAGGEAFVSATPALRLEEPTDPFPDLYMQYCASTEELRSIRQRMEGMRPPPPPPIEVPIPGALPPPSGPGEAVAPDPPPRDRPPPRPQGDDSFFNSVVRPPRDAAAP